MRGLFGAIAADRHAAPSSRAPARMVGEHQRAAMSFASFHVGEDLLRTRTSPTLRRSAAAEIREIASAASCAVPSDRHRASRCRDIWLNISSRSRSLFKGNHSCGALGGSGRPIRLANKSSEPLAQGARLLRNLVQLTRHRSRLQLIEDVRRNKLGLSQPPQEPIAAVEPIDGSIDRRRDGVQKIKAERVGDKNCRRSVFHDWPREGSNRITGQTVD